MKTGSIALTAILLLIAGCAGVTVRDPASRVRGFDFSPAKALTVAAMNTEIMQERYRDEWQFNRGAKDRPPKLCLAMSGGGMRSASFNIGVLAGLHDAKILDRIDVMSSVSGGGYALSWYFLQLSETGTKEDELFDRDGRFQKYLQNHANLAYENPETAFRWLRYLTEFGKWLPALPAHLVANGFFDWHANLNPLRRAYENGIERVFHATPVSIHPEIDGYRNRAGFWSTSAIDADKQVTFPSIRDTIARRKLPFFVINTTVAIDDDSAHHGSQWRNVIYEFTPLQHGSDAFGDRFREFPFHLGRAVSISGAAKDSSINPGAKRQLFDSMTNTDLGYFISNPSPDVKASTRNLNQWLPIPFYLAVPNYQDAVGTDIYLTDGGHSDNLAVFSLVRRMCGEIIVVDAEHDPRYEFGGLKQLSAHLLSELQVGLNLSEPFDVSHPVRTGHIGTFPVRYSGRNVVSRDIRIRYLKLSMDPQRLSEYSDTVRTYYLRHGVKGDRNDRFPQQSTADINYNEAQYLAYRDLGADMVRLYLAPAMQVSVEQAARTGLQ